MKNLPRWAKQTAIVLFWLLCWQALSLLIRNRILLVGPVETLRALSEQVVLRSFWQAVGFSTGRICLGFLLAFFGGLLTGALAFRFPFLGELLAPPIQLLKTIPVASFVILALIWTGSEKLSILISFIVVYPVIYVATVTGLEHTDRKLLEIAKVFRVPAWRTAMFVYRPAIYPYLASACRTALGMGFKSGIAAEVIGVPDGSIGEGLYMAKIYLSTAELFTWTLVIILAGVAFEKLFLIVLRAAAGRGIVTSKYEHGKE